MNLSFQFDILIESLEEKERQINLMRSSEGKTDEEISRYDENLVTVQVKENLKLKKFMICIAPKVSLKHFFNFAWLWLGVDWRCQKNAG